MVVPAARQRDLRRSFSLLELLIVIVALSIIALLAMPSVAHHETTRLQMAARLLVADLEFAQVQSIGNGANPCQVVFTTLDHGYHISRQADPDTPVIEPATGMPHVTRFGHGRAHALAGVRLESVEVGGDGALGFTALGALDQGADAVLTLRCGSRVTHIRLDSSTGEPVIE